MALVHKVQFSSIVEMVMEVVEVYTEFEPLDPLPAWWEKFEAWADAANIDDATQLEAKLKEIDEKTKEDRPDWWKLAEKAFKAAKSFKVVVLRTDADGADGEDKLAVESEPDNSEPDDSGADADADDTDAAGEDTDEPSA
jgi:hypothetical protein